MADCKPISTPKDVSDSNYALVKAGAKGREDIHFRSAVGALNYLAIATRPDISTAVGEVARQVENPQPHHFVMIKRIFRYLQGTSTHGIYFGNQGKSDGIVLEGYSDANWGEDKLDRRSITGMLFSLGCGPISWKSKKQATVAASTAEAEYMALFNATQEAVWARQLLFELGFPQQKPTVIHEDNQGCIAMSKNPVRNSRTKHIDIKYQFTREKIQYGTISVQYCPTEYMLADFRTKGLSRDRFQTFVHSASIRDPNSCGTSGSVGNDVPAEL
jgi:hypothetical protein